MLSLCLAFVLLQPAKPETSQQEKSLMRFSFPKEEEFKYRIKMDMSMDMMGETMNQSVSFVQTYNTKEQRDQWTVLTASLEDFEMETDADTEEMTELVFEMEVSARGELGKVSMQDEESPGMASMMGGAMGGMKGAGFMGFIYPEEAIGVGSTWITTIDASKMMEGMGMMGEMASGSGEMKVECEVIEQKVADGIAFMVIVAKTTGALTFSFEVGDESAEMTMNFDGTMTHTVEVASGLVSLSQGEVTIKNSGDMFEMSQTMKMSIERLPKEAALVLQ